jgi:hypothetical protein
VSPALAPTAEHALANHPMDHMSLEKVDDDAKPIRPTEQAVPEDSADNADVAIEELAVKVGATEDPVVQELSNNQPEDEALAAAQLLEADIVATSLQDSVAAPQEHVPTDAEDSATLDEPTTVDEQQVEEPTIEEPAIGDSAPIVESALAEVPARHVTGEEAAIAPAVNQESATELSTVREPASEGTTTTEEPIAAPAIKLPSVEEPTAREQSVEQPTIKHGDVERPEIDEPVVEGSAGEETMVEEAFEPEPSVEEPLTQASGVDGDGINGSTVVELHDSATVIVDSTTLQASNAASVAPEPAAEPFPSSEPALVVPKLSPIDPSTSTDAEPERTMEIPANVLKDAELPIEDPLIKDITAEAPPVVQEPELEDTATTEESIPVQPVGVVSQHEELKPEACTHREPTVEQPVIELIAEEEPAVSLLDDTVPVEGTALVEEPLPDSDARAPEQASTEGTVDISYGEELEPQEPSPSQTTVEQPVVELIAEEQPPVSILAGDIPAEGTAVVEEPAVERGDTPVRAETPLGEEASDKKASVNSESEPVSPETAVEEAQVEPATLEFSKLEEPTIVEDATEEPSELESEEPTAAEVALEKPAEAEAISHPVDDPAVEMPSADAAIDNVPAAISVGVDAVTNITSTASESSITETVQEPLAAEAESAPQEDASQGSGSPDELPAALESVVLSGSTPGPQVALSTSEPAAMHQAPDDIGVSASEEVHVTKEEKPESSSAEEHVVRKLVPSAEEERELIN